MTGDLVLYWLVWGVSFLAAGVLGIAVLWMGVGVAKKLIRSIKGAE